ncbi:unnamed protein product [Leptosia nina]|uniref:RNA-directed DNA polymerase n=1 Tax=Leptosia nina TaxID=320188 RepID=A0AAV1K054_9NEOP
MSLRELSIKHEKVDVEIGTLFKFIKSFDGTREKLNSFLSNCDNATSLASETQKPILFKYILSQLNGKAETACSIKEFDSWDQLNHFLKTQFGETKHYTHLLADLQECRQLNIEPVNQFALRVETCLSKLLTEVTLSNKKKTELLGRTAAMEDLALHTFLLGLKPDISNLVRGKNPSTLNEAINLATSEEKILNLFAKRNSHTSVPQRQGSKPNYSFKPFPNTNARPQMPKQPVRHDPIPFLGQRRCLVGPKNLPLAITLNHNDTVSISKDNTGNQPQASVHTSKIRDHTGNQPQTSAQTSISKDHTGNQPQASVHTSKIRDHTGNQPQASVHTSKIRDHTGNQPQTSAQTSKTRDHTGKQPQARVHTTTPKDHTGKQPQARVHTTTPKDHTGKQPQARVHTTTPKDHTGKQSQARVQYHSKPTFTQFTSSNFVAPNSILNPLSDPESTNSTSYPCSKVESILIKFMKQSTNQLIYKKDEVIQLKGINSNNETVPTLGHFKLQLFDSINTDLRQEDNFSPITLEDLGELPLIPTDSDNPPSVDLLDNEDPLPSILSPEEVQNPPLPALTSPPLTNESYSKFLKMISNKCFNSTAKISECNENILKTNYKHIIIPTSIDLDESNPYVEQVLSEFQNPSEILYKERTLYTCLCLELNTKHIHFLFTKVYHFDSCTYEDIFKCILFIKNHILNLSSMSPTEENIQIAFTDFRNSFDKHTWIRIYNMFSYIFTSTNFEIKIYHDCLVYPSLSETRKILHDNHDIPIAGHLGTARMLNRIKEKYYWKNMRSDIENYIKNCSLCQSNKAFRQTNRAPMQITTTSTKPFERLSMDLEYILTMQDNLTKFSFAYPIANATSEDTFECLVHFISLFGIPRMILTDQGTNFTAELFKKTCEFLKIKQIWSSPYHPQTQGALERSHSTLKEYLKSYVNENQSNWHRFVFTAMLSYNTSVHASTNFTPYELLFGHKAYIPDSIYDLPTNITYPEYIKFLQHRLKLSREKAHENAIKSKERSKGYYDNHSRPVEYQAGDYVYLKNHVRLRKALSPVWKGPYKVIKINGRNSLTLLINRRHVTHHYDEVKLASSNFLAAGQFIEEKEISPGSSPDPIGSLNLVDSHLSVIVPKDVSYINRHLLNLQFNINHSKLICEESQIFNPSECRNLFQPLIARYEDMIRYSEAIPDLSSHHIIKRSPLLGIVGTISKKLFSTMDEEDAIRYNNAVKEIQLDQKKIASYIKDNIIVRNRP